MVIDKKILVATVIALVLGGALGFCLGTRGLPEVGEHRMGTGQMMHDGDMTMGNAMDDMMAGLKGKTGDEFDKEFLAEMIVHHQGAVDMAQEVLTSGKHPELKDFAQKIISAQTAEIKQMQGWQKSWYGN